MAAIRAKTPARTPGPTATTNMIATISSGIERPITRTTRITRYTHGVAMLRAAKNAITRASRPPTAVPITAVKMESRMPDQIRSPAVVKSGGK